MVTSHTLTNNSRRPIAVLILNWNGRALLEKYLPSVREHTPSALAEVIVADNGSTDDSVPYLKSLGVRVLEMPVNSGFAGGYNRAIAQLDHEYIVLLNSDVRVTPGWLEPLYAFMQKQPDAVSVQPKIRADRAPEYLEYAGACGGHLDHLGYPFCKGRLFETVEKDEGQFGDEPMPIFWTTGAAMMVRRKAYMAEGGLDESFFAHQEEIDLCWRWLAKGFHLYVVPKSVIYHYGGASLSSSNPKKAYLNFRNNLSMLYKNLPKSRLWSTFFVRFFMDVLAALVFTLKGSPAEGRAVFKAWGDFFKHKPERKEGYNRMLAYKKLYGHSIVFQYQIARNRRYNDLPHKQ